MRAEEDRLDPRGHACLQPTQLWALNSATPLPLLDSWPQQEDCWEKGVCAGVLGGCSTGRLEGFLVTIQISLGPWVLMSPPVVLCRVQD